LLLCWGGGWCFLFLIFGWLHCGLFVLLLGWWWWLVDLFHLNVLSQNIQPLVERDFPRGIPVEHRQHFSDEADVDPHAPEAVVQLLLVDQSVVVDVYPVEGLCLAQPAVLDGDAELVDDLLRGYLLVVYGPFELGVQFIVVGAVLLDLLDGVETADGRHELLPRDLAVSVQVEQVHPLPYLIPRLLRQQLPQPLFQLKLAYSRLTVGLCLLKYHDRVELPVSENHAQLLDTLLELLVLNILFVLDLDVLHGLEVDLVPHFSLERGVPHF
jgi:hypothetical protein